MDKYSWRTNHCANYRNAVATVDAVVIDVLNSELIVGKRKNEEGFRFFGGFLDPTIDSNTKRAAERELKEECKNLYFNYWFYLGDLIVNDRRFKEDKNSLLTHVHIFKYIRNVRPDLPLTGGDDIDEVHRVKLYNNGSKEYCLMEHKFIPEHRDILNWILSKINIKTEITLKCNS